MLNISLMWEWGRVNSFEVVAGTTQATSSQYALLDWGGHRLWPQNDRVLRHADLHACTGVRLKQRTTILYRPHCYTSDYH